MLQQKSRLDGLTKITFGATVNDRHRTLGWCALLAGAVAAMIDLFFAPIYWWSFWIAFCLVLLPAAIVYLYSRHELTFDFSEDVFTYQTGSYPTLIKYEGSLSEISAIHIGKQQAGEHHIYTTSLLFREDLQRLPLHLESLPCSVPIHNFRERIELCLDLARRLNIPVYDDSGWQDWAPPIFNPERIVIQPGEVHPVLAPKVWKRW